MVAVQNPLDKLNFGEDEALYVAYLERRLAMSVVTEARFRVLLEILTGEKWDDENLNITEEQLREVATTTLHRTMAITMEAARKKANERIAEINKRAVPERHTKVN